MLKIIIIAAFLISAVNSGYSKNFNIINTGSDSLKIEKQNSPVPDKFDIYSPRVPLTPQKYILFDVPENSDVSIKMYDYDNKFISELINKNFEAGTYYIDMYNIAKLKSLPSGVYFLEMKSGNFSKQKKIIYVK
ncbi:MAG: T9SS type A sorting domain-containing protein [Bacteroidetes bacterium]|nr:T9SS type A sorting domain-containing protein [Bacteroidota bacterium]